MAYSTPPSLRKRHVRDEKKRQGAHDHPLAMSSGLGATLALGPRPRIQTLGRISYPSKASGAAPGGCARVHPLEESNTKTSRGLGNDLAKT
jgi:hypothetical protein